MCTVSMVGDHFSRTLPQRYDWLDGFCHNPPTSTITVSPSVSVEDFEALKRDVEEMKRLLQNAKEIDAKTGQPDCEMDVKVDLLRKVARLVGVDLSDVFRSPA